MNEFNADGKRITGHLDLAAVVLVPTLICTVGEINVQLLTVRIPCVIASEIKVCVDRSLDPAQPEVPHSVEGSTSTSALATGSLSRLI